MSTMTSFLAKLQSYVTDRAIVRLARAYLDAGVLKDGVKVQRRAGTPQGGPRSPLLAKAMLDEADRERCALHFEPYADDCNLYVRSQGSGKRRLSAGLHEAEARRQRGQDLGTERLRCEVPGLRPVGSSGGESQTGRWRAPRSRSSSVGCVRSLEAVAVAAWAKVIEELGVYVRRLDEWMRHRLRAIQLKHGKRGTTIYRETRRWGAAS